MKQPNLPPTNRPIVNQRDSHPTNNPQNNLSNKTMRTLDPEIIEKKNWAFKYGRLVIAIGVILILVQVGFMLKADLGTTNSWILAFSILVIFGAIIYFTMEPKSEREIRQRIIETELRTIEKPVIQEVIKEVEKPIVKETIVPVIKEVEKPVIREIIKTVEVPVVLETKTVYAADPHDDKKLFPFIASNQTGVFHKSTCRIARSIESKHLLRGKNASLFKNKGFRPCKICIG